MSSRGGSSGTESPSFGAWLRRRRRALDLTQAELARQVGYAEATIRRIEADELRPSKELATRLAEHLELAPVERAAFVRFARGAALGSALPLPRLAVPESIHFEPSPGHNLPIPLTSFVGREQELLEVPELLRRTRLLTLIGAGGCGKTRLALRLGYDLISAYPDGVWLVDLAPLADPDLVAPALATVLGVGAAPRESILATMIGVLKPKQVLLLLDNCEHVIQACARLAQVVLQQCPSPCILATSREPLGIAGEVRWLVPPLAVPPDELASSLSEVAGYAAARLFLDRARSTLPTFQPQDQEAAAVARICRRLDGLPLALELAAPLVAVLSVDEIAARMDRRFDLLLGGTRTALPRHQTLAALVNWSYDLLEEPERTLFNRLAVFAGAFSLEAAETVCASADLSGEAIVPVLARLVGKSLVVAQPGGTGSDRYHLLETLRQFGRERLEVTGESAEVFRRHAQFYLALVDEADTSLRGPEQVVWLQRLEAHQDNLRVALTWLERNGQVREAFHFAAALAFFWGVCGHYAEGRAHLTRLLDRPEATACLAEQARALWGAGFLARRQGDRPEAGRRFEQCLAVASRAADHVTMARALCGLADWALSQEEATQAQRYAHEGLARSRELGDRSCIAEALYWSALSAADLSSEDAMVRPPLEEALDLCRQSGDVWGASRVLGSLGQRAVFRGDYDTARAYFAELLRNARALGDRSSIANALIYLGQVDVEQGALTAARSRFKEGLAIYRDRGDKVGIAWATSDLSNLALVGGELPRARAFADESLTVAREIVAIDWTVIALLCGGGVAIAEDDASAARRYFVEGLLLAKNGRAVLVAQALEGVARLAAARNEPVRALRLLGQAEALRDGSGIPTRSYERVRLERALQSIRDAPGGLNPTDQEVACSEGRAMTRDKAIAYALEEIGGDMSEASADA